MNSRNRKTVLISEPSASTELLYLPYVWGILKSYRERAAGVSDCFEWLDPIYLKAPVERLLEPYRDTRIDVLGLSCYTWNWPLQCVIAHHVKTANPDCLVVAGGPEPDYKDPDFFRQHPYIDAIAVKDGEKTFNKILTKVADGDRDLTDIGGLYLPGKNRSDHTYTGPAELPTDFDYSPYLAQSPLYEELIDRHGVGGFRATWETNRGCPYSCSFCDWGSNTMSKIRRFDMERVQAEMDWFGRMRIDFIFLADANFGIFPRDLEIADHINAVHREYGHPKAIYYSTAKNNPERTVEIAKKFFASGVSSTFSLAIQHTNRQVLANTDRANISKDKQLKVVKNLMEHNIPVDAQLILGIPGDTYELWKHCLTELMDVGIHDDYWIFLYNVLPNAPAADPEFNKRWEIETIDRHVDSMPHSPHPPFDPVLMPKSKIIIKTKTFSRDDWVKMCVYASFIQALHNCSVTRLIAQYLRFTHNVPYLDFYETLIEQYFPRTPAVSVVYGPLLAHYQNFLVDEDGCDYVAIEQLPGLPYRVNVCRWLYVQICYNLDPMFATLKTFLRNQYPDAENLDDLVDYQKNLIILPSYDAKRGKEMPVEADWIAYFEKVNQLTTYEPLPEPEPSPGAMVEVSDRTSGDDGYMRHSLDWCSTDEEERWKAWIAQSVLHRNSAGRSNFQQLRLRGSLAAAR